MAVSLFCRKFYECRNSHFDFIVGYFFFLLGNALRLPRSYLAIECLPDTLGDVLKSRQMTNTSVLP